MVVLQLHSVNFERQFTPKTNLIDLLLWHLSKTPASPFHTLIFRIFLLQQEREQTYEFLKSSGPISPVRDWIFCTSVYFGGGGFIYFFFFSLKVQCFWKNSGMRLTAPFLSARLIMDALTVRWDNPLFAPLWVALARPQIQPDETRRHAVGFSVHCVAQYFQTGLGGGGRCGWEIQNLVAKQMQPSGCSAEAC